MPLSFFSLLRGIAGDFIKGILMLLESVELEFLKFKIFPKLNPLCSFGFRWYVCSSFICSRSFDFSLNLNLSKTLLFLFSAFENDACLYRFVSWLPFSSAYLMSWANSFTLTLFMKTLWNALDFITLSS